jgi:hypothetical protein
MQQCVLLCKIVGAVPHHLHDSALHDCVSGAVWLAQERRNRTLKYDGTPASRLHVRQNVLGHESVAFDVDGCGPIPVFTGRVFNGRKDEESSIVDQHVYLVTESAAIR